jgi:heat shock protein HslJ
MRTGGRTKFALFIVAGMLLSAGLLVSGCGASVSDEAPVSHPPVVGVGWLMKSYSKGGDVTEMHQGVRLPSLKFKPDNTVQVFDGCNSGGGKAVVNNDNIVFGPIMTTLMGCPAGTAEVSSAILSVLHGTVDYSFEDGNLVLKNGDRALTYTGGTS